MNIEHLRFGGIKISTEGFGGFVAGCRYIGDHLASLNDESGHFAAMPDNKDRLETNVPLKATE